MGRGLLYCRGNKWEQASPFQPSSARRIPHSKHTWMGRIGSLLALLKPHTNGISESLKIDLYLRMFSQPPIYGRADEFLKPFFARLKMKMIME